MRREALCGNAAVIRAALTGKSAKLFVLAYLSVHSISRHDRQYESEIANRSRIGCIH